MHTLTVKELAGDLRSRKISSRELTAHLLDRIEHFNARLNAFITVTREQALVQAEEADRHLARGEGGPLMGIPIAHKDIFCTEGVKTSCGSRILDNFVSPYDATLVERLRAAGTVLVGKTNMDEFAMGSSNENSFYGPVKNPWDETRVPGGSSGGSAAAVAARLVPCATGTDTGGSIRQPAALSGVTGLKPTYGRVSRYGMVAFASSLDQGGVLAATAEDCAIVLATMAGFDPRDSTSVDEAVPDYRAGLDRPVSGLRIGVLKEFFDEGLEPQSRQALEDALKVYERLGASLIDVSLPHLSLSVPAYYVVASAEASSNLSRYDGVRYGYRCKNPRDLLDMYERTRGEGFGIEVKRRIMTGTYVLSAGYYDAYYLKAQKVRQLISGDFGKAFEQVDIIAGPVSPTPAFGLGEKIDDPVTMYLTDVYTIGVNLAGLPGIAIPCGLAQHLPVGLQLIGPHFSEPRLLNVAHMFQQETDWHSRLPDSRYQ